MRKVLCRNLLLLLLATLAIGCREEMVEELEDMGFKREWIPFGDAMGLPPLDENYHYRWLSDAPPWFVSQLVTSPYDITLDTAGQGSNKYLRINSETDKGQFMRLGRRDNLAGLAGHRIRFTASIQPKDWQGDISLGHILEEDKKSIDEIDTKLPEGRWSKVSFEADIQPNAENLVIIMEFDGKGELLIDDCKIEKLGPSSKGGVPREVVTAQRNLGFDEGPYPEHKPISVIDSLQFRIAPWSVWYNAGQYQVLLDSTHAQEGRYCGGLRATQSDPLEKAHLFYSIPAELVRAHKIKYSVWLKGDGLNGLVTLAARSATLDRIITGKQDHLWDMVGTTGWTKYSGEVDVPADSRYMEVAIIYTGQGTLLVDNLTYEKVARLSGTPDYIDKSHFFAKPFNLGFEGE